MMKKFCRAGPVDPKCHYFIPNRLQLNNIDTLIQDKEYFVLHAPRQSGKTTAIEEYRDALNAQGVYNALYINIEPAQAARDNVKEALIAILAELRASLRNQLPEEKETIGYIEEQLSQPQRVTFTSLVDALEFWAKTSKKPTVLFIDEIDALIGDSLLSVLRQIRRGFSKRPELFPQSICLIGLRDVRDYRVWSREEGTLVSTASPFNIKAQSLLLDNFSLEQVTDLYGQHTKETGQVFEKEAAHFAFYLTQGQPWLVNALGYEAAFVEVTDRTQPITREIIEKAKETLIKRRDTHLDSLIDRLQDSRVRPIIDAIIEGEVAAINFDFHSMQYVRDLGLIKRDRMEIANPIYQEVIPRELTAITSQGLAEKYVLRPGYVRPDGSLHMAKLLVAFTEFYRENSSIWLEKFDYKESGPHLLLMAFLQRIINGGGRILREYALGRGRVDLLIIWQNQQRIVLELKVKRESKTLAEGLEQTAGYMDGSKATEGHLLIFDRDPNKSWEEKIHQTKNSYQNHTIHVWQL
jgi:hypothetical protein